MIYLLLFILALVMVVRESWLLRVGRVVLWVVACLAAWILYVQSHTVHLQPTLPVQHTCPVVWS